jgi:hypothetical protein
MTSRVAQLDHLEQLRDAVRGRAALAGDRMRKVSAKAVDAYFHDTVWRSRVVR